jgi:putative membrane protein
MPGDIPFCGAPPVPGAAGWTLDPTLLALLGLLGALGAWRAWGEGRARLLAWLLGWAVLALALVSPLCNLAVALFSARVGQHMLIALVAAPLLAFGAFGAGSPRVAALGPATLAFALAFWGWHLPGPYAASFRGDGPAWWAMHLSTAGAAVWLWAALLARAAERPDAAALAGLATAVQMGLLGGLLTLAPRPLYAPHVLGNVTLPWGLTALEDQQLGGLIMWVPGGMLFAALMLGGLALALRRGERDRDAGGGVLRPAR